MSCSRFVVTSSVFFSRGERTVFARVGNQKANFVVLSPISQLCTCTVAARAQSKHGLFYAFDREKKTDTRRGAIVRTLSNTRSALNWHAKHKITFFLQIADYEHSDVESAKTQPNDIFVLR